LVCQHAENEERRGILRVKGRKIQMFYQKKTILLSWGLMTREKESLRTRLKINFEVVLMHKKEIEIDFNYPIKLFLF
jgi:hypothetical protein